MKYYTVCLLTLCIVQVLAQSDGDVRLVGGYSASSGRADVFYRGQWGSICDDRFNIGAAHVICRGVGFSDARPTKFNARYFGVGTGRILLDEVRCFGNETNILSCSRRAVGEHNCQHREDVAIDCYGQDVGKALELRNGTSTDGVLVLTYVGGSGTVCRDNYWGNAESVVACRMMGVDTSSAFPLVVSRKFYGESTELPMLMSGVVCRGNEKDLSQCEFYGMAATRCLYNRVVAIDCLGGANVEAMLVNGNDTAGEVRLAYYEHSGAVCRTNVGRRSAKVYCRMLGFEDYEGVVLRATEVTSDTNVILSATVCYGYEKNIAYCRNELPLGEGVCPQDHGLVAIACLPQGDISARIVEGNATFGRLEVQHNGQWGTVCVDSIDRAATIVICRMLNLPTEHAAAFTRNYPPQVNLPVLLDEVECAGTEEHLNQCYHEEWGRHDCDHTEDVWVKCE